MTERLADIDARIGGIRQLGSVVNAMRGIAAARAQQARNQLAAVDSYAQTIALAIGRALALMPPDALVPPSRTPRPALLVFGAEQGFAGAFSERVFDAAGADLGKPVLFLLGTRAAAVAAARGITPAWQGIMPSHASGIPPLAERIAEALYARIGT
ncbi:MAG: F0F1 ATP synthase subunit gamma, partial [Microbacteriaceae bacterium]|nr:F0F1 ATP synthase subunit gamma [Burkholderiaceae bacterium]